MENNENNIQNQQDIEQVNSKDKKITVALLVIVLILVLAIGVGVGFLFTGGKNKSENNTVTNNTTTNNSVETKANKKIDETKDWVYDAEYCVNNTNKVAYGMFAGEEFNSKEYLKVPYINVNSEYAKKVNEEIKEMYDKIYSTFGDKSGEVSKAGKLNYEFGKSDKILSVAITCSEGVTNAGWSKDYITYNINLETLEKATLEDVCKECGFESVAQLEEKVKISIVNNKDNVTEDATWDSKTGLYYMDASNEFNIIVMGNVNYINLTIKPDVTSTTVEKTNSEVKKEIIASGWAGSSMHRVRLYSNGEAYYITFNGNGETDDCIIGKDLVARNAEDIIMKNGEHGEFAGVIVKGKNMTVVNRNATDWIFFETANEDTNTNTATTNTNSEYDNAIAAMKKCLKDESWLKANVYITASQQIIEGDLSDQTVDFIICRGDKLPIVIIEVASDNARYHKIVLVAYVNGSVKTEIINQGHIYHGGFAVDANKNVVSSVFMHMGDNSTSLRKITNGTIKFLGEYGYCEESTDGKISNRYYIVDETMQKNGTHKDVSEAEYNSYKASLNESQYKFVSIGTELNNQNVDEFIK